MFFDFDNLLLFINIDNRNIFIIDKKTTKYREQKYINILEIY